MIAVNRNESGLFVYDPKFIGKGCHASAAVTTHCTFIPVGIKVFQGKVKSALVFKQHQPVGSDT
jgi:hypothetical protein